MKTAIIVGGSRGIGLAIARKFTESGFSVTLVASNEANLQKGIDSLKFHAQTKGVESSLHYEVCNLANENEINDCSQRLIGMKRPIDILVNSAGITQNKLLVSSSNDSIKSVLNINLLGTILFTKCISKQMIRQKHGAIINIGSIIGCVGNWGQTAYAASKSGLSGFTKSLAKELGSKGITVNLIAPGFIETDMTKESLTENQIEEIKRKIVLKRIGSANEVANVAHFLATSSYITGEVLNVDGGLRLTF